MTRNLCLMMLAGLLLAGGCGNGSATLDEPAETDTMQAADVAPEDTVTLPETNFYEIRTPQGRMVIRLYDETPMHRDNFKRLVEEQFYDSTLFHRVIGGFMVQGGDPNSLNDDPYDDGQGGPGYLIPAEIRPGLIHKRGALAAARTGDRMNPQRESSGSQFYIVQGRPYPDSILTVVENRTREMIPDPNFAFADSVRARYTTEGGAPELDGMYTVFGELVEGFDVLDAIGRTATPRRMGQRVHRALLDRPLTPVWMIVRPLPEWTPDETSE